MQEDDQAPRRSDRTRSAILRAARNRFATDGYDRATIRAIAADAEIDPSMVMRYFGTKAALFDAAASFDLDVPELSAVPRGKLGVTFARRVIERWELADNEAERTLFRTAVTHPIGVQRVQRIFDEQIRAAFTPLLADDPDREARMALLVAQGIGTAMGRYIIGIEPLASYPTEALIHAVGATMQRILTAPLPPAARADPSPTSGRTPGR